MSEHERKTNKVEFNQLKIELTSKQLTTINFMKDGVTVCTQTHNFGLITGDSLELKFTQGELEIED
jgi:hypothetical protein